MALPARSFFRLDEVAKAWEASIFELLTLALEGNLQLAVILVGQEVERGSVVNGSYEPTATETVTRPLAVYAEDVWPLGDVKSVLIERFIPEARDCYLRPAAPAGKCRVTLSSVVVTRLERERFERSNNISVGSDSVPSFPFQPSADYSFVTCNGLHFKLGPVQASIVKALHQASQTPEPWVNGMTLLADAGSKSFWVGDVFKSHRRWKELILSNGKGRYRLNVPLRSRLAPRRIFRREANNSNRDGRPVRAYAFAL